MALADVKVLYASAPRGLQLTIPLIQTGAYNVADITQRLKNAGVQDDELPFVVFSSVPRASGSPARNAADIGGAGNPLGVERSAMDAPDPDIPVPTTAGEAPPPTSEFQVIAKVAVTPNWRQLTGCRYSMRRADGQGMVAVQDLTQDQFADPEDFARVRDGRIKLCYGKVWRRAAMHFVNDGDKWVDSVQTKNGMSTTNSVSVTASVGYSGEGASASLSATYGYSITVTSETTVTIEVSVLGKPGESQTAALWELCRATALEVDGVQRDGSNPYTIIYADKNGQHQLADAWSADIEVGTNIEIISQQPTLKTKIFKDAPSALAGV